MPVFTRATRILFWRELRAIAVAPASHVVAAIFMVLQGLGFIHALKPFTESPQERGLVEAFFQGALFWIPFFALFPLLTMRLFAEEQKLGTMEMLLTAPVRVREVVLGKYLATLVFFVVLWIPTVAAFLVYPWLLGGTTLHLSPTLWSALAMVLAMGLMNLAVGCFASALTTSQIGAGILTFGLLMLMFLFGHLPTRLGELADPAQRFFQYVHADAHLRDAAAGQWDTRPFVFYLSAAVLLLGATGYALNSRRWQS